MKKLLPILSIFCLSILSAQTTLSPGDIMFIGVNSDYAGSPQSDEFAIIFLEPVDANTEIYFTDMGYTGNSSPFFQQNVNNGCASGTGAASDGILKWTTNAMVPAGTQLVFRVKIDGVNGPTCSIGSVSTIVETQTAGTTMNLSSGGEAIHAFQGTFSGNQVASATMLASIDYDAFWTSSIGTCEYSSTISENPNTGYEVVFTAHFDNGHYSGPLSGSKSYLQSQILDNTNNWSKNNTSISTLPLTSSFNLSNPDLKKISVIKMHPNPTSDFVFINEAVNKVSVFNSLGQQVLTAYNKQFSMKALKDGIYLVEIETPNNTVFKKLIKN